MPKLGGGVGGALKINLRKCEREKEPHNSLVAVGALSSFVVCNDKHWLLVRIYKYIPYEQNSDIPKNKDHLHNYIPMQKCCSAEV